MKKKFMGWENSMSLLKTLTFVEERFSVPYAELLEMASIKLLPEAILMPETDKKRVVLFHVPYKLEILFDDPQGVAKLV